MFLYIKKNSIYTEFLIAICLFILLSFSNLYSQTINGVDYVEIYGNVGNIFDTSDDNDVGLRFPSEHKIIIDDETGVEIIVLTTSRYNNTKTYQTHPQWTADGNYIIFRSNRLGRSHAYAISMNSYEIIQVTSGQDGSNLHLGWTENVAYHFRGNELIKLDLERLLNDSKSGTLEESSNYEEIIATVPENISPRGIALDANENRIFFLERKESDLYRIYSLDFRTSETTMLAEMPMWLGHLQANPWVTGEIMYCWETAGDAPQRMWYLTIEEDGSIENGPVYKETPGEWITHEVFMGPDHIIFNVMGHVQRLRENGTTGIFTKNIRTKEVKKYDNIPGFGYFHVDGITTSGQQWAVGDSFDGKLYRIDLENGNRTLLTTGHRPGRTGPQDGNAHAHQSISPDGKWVLFNSSMHTNSDIMMVRLHPNGLE